VRGPDELYGTVPDDPAGPDADDLVVFRESGSHHRRQQHNVELGYIGGDESHGDAREFFFDLREQLSGIESDGDYDLHSDGDEHHRLDHSDGDGERFGTEPADDQLIHREPDKH